MTRLPCVCCSTTVFLLLVIILGNVCAQALPQEGGTSANPSGDERDQLKSRARQLEQEFLRSYSEGDYSSATRLLEQLLSTYESLYPKAQYPQGHPELAAGMQFMGRVQYLQGKYDRAQEYYQQALDMCKRLYRNDQYPQGHPTTAQIMDELGFLFDTQGEYKQAWEYYEQALATTEALYPESQFPNGHPAVALVHNHLGLVLEHQCQYESARKHYEHALAIQQRLYPKDRYPRGHPDLASNLNNLGKICVSQGDCAQAQKYFLQAVAMGERLYPSGHPLLAAYLDNLGSVLQRGGEYKQAQEYRSRAFAIYRSLYPEDQFPKGHPNLATSLNNLGLVLNSQAEYELARQYYMQALEMYQRLYPKDQFPQGHRDLATSLNNVGLVLLNIGDHGHAREYLERALAMYQSLYSKEQYPLGYSDVARSLNNLGGLLKDQGDYARAREYLEQAVEMYKRLFPQGHPELATSLGNVGAVLADQGEYKRAREYYEQALVMQQRFYPERKYPQGHPDVAGSLNNLGDLFAREGEYVLAAECHQKALAMRKRLYPEDQYPHGHPNLALSLSNLGASLENQGHYERAEEYHEQALAMRTRVYARNQYPQGHPDLVVTLSNLGLVFARQGKYSQAIRYSEQALDMCETLYPESQYPCGHSTLITVLNNLGGALMGRGDFDRASACVQRAANIQQRQAADFFAGASEAECLRFAMSRAPLFLLSTSRHTEQPAEEVYPYIWSRRRLIQHLIAERQRTFQEAGSPEVRSLYQEYLSTRRALARLVLAPADPVPEGAAARGVRLRELGERKERLERELADTSPEFLRQFQQQRRPHTDLSGQLPRGSVFIDLQPYLYFEQDPEVPGKAGEKWTPSYVAFLLLPNQPVIRVELGPAEPIDDAVKTWREDIALFRPSSADDVLRQLVWEPLEEHLPEGTDTIYLCPDSALTRVPWPALPSADKDTILLQDYAFTVVPHGPFLLEQLTAEPATGDDGDVFLAVGGVSYDDKPTAVPQSDMLVTRAAVTGDKTIRWPPLPATTEELDELETAAEGRQLTRLAGSEASTSRVLGELPNARWAHFATHGFFADAKIRSALQWNAEDFERHQFFQLSERTTVVGRNPLVLSGLVFAGANLPREKDEFGISQGDGGILTAEAIAGLPLHNLELAVLSACDTGLGEVAGGEGVFGLQRAFHLAGAHNVVASLWKVDDQPTAALMRLFYHKLWVEKKPPIVALRESQLALYRNPDKIGDLATTRGPVFNQVVELVDSGSSQTPQKTAPVKVWAAFVLSGAGR